MQAKRRTRIKICGITRPEDALAAAELGADAIGLVFYAKSPRGVTGEQARRIVKDLPPFVNVVGLFVDAQPELIRDVLREVPLDLLQFHGEETPEQCVGYGRPYIKAVPMRETVDLRREASQHETARGLLLDAYLPGIPGGSGCRFDWERIPRELAKPIVLAGGLGLNNVFQAVTVVRPFAVDVSSGVEASKGIKDHAKMAEFIREVQSADAG